MGMSVDDKLITVLSIFLILTFTTVILRCYVRIKMVKIFGADDVLAVMSLVGPSSVTRNLEIPAYRFV